MGMTATSGFMSMNSMGGGKPPSAFSPYDNGSQMGAATSGSTYGAAASHLDESVSPKKDFVIKTKKTNRLGTSSSRRGDATGTA